MSYLIGLITSQSMKCIFVIWVMLYPALAQSDEAMKFRLTNKGKAIEVCLVNNSLQAQLINTRLFYYHAAEYYFKVVDENGIDYPLRILFKIAGVTKEDYSIIESGSRYCVLHSFSKLKDGHDLPAGQYSITGFYEDHVVLSENAFSGKLTSNSIALSIK